MIHSPLPVDLLQTRKTRAHGMAVVLALSRVTRRPPTTQLLGQTIKNNFA
jgi:hypothetical protein